MASNSTNNFDPFSDLYYWEPCCVKISDTIAINFFSEKTMNQTHRIQIDPAVCHGKPVIQNTRVPVSIVVGSLAAGMTVEDVKREYDLTEEDIRAALAFANDLVQQESFHTLPHVA
jgi:uncharacterized protein (DUF433 family)